MTGVLRTDKGIGANGRMEESGKGGTAHGGCELIVKPYQCAGASDGGVETWVSRRGRPEALWHIHGWWSGMWSFGRGGVVSGRNSKALPITEPATSHPRFTVHAFFNTFWWSWPFLIQLWIRWSWNCARTSTVLEKRMHKVRALTWCCGRVYPSLEIDCHNRKRAWTSDSAWTCLTRCGKSLMTRDGLDLEDRRTSWVFYMTLLMMVPVHWSPAYWLFSRWHLTATSRIEQYLNWSQWKFKEQPSFRGDILLSADSGSEIISHSNEIRRWILIRRLRFWVFCCQ